jgi:hypothetical protein
MEILKMKLKYVKKDHPVLQLNHKIAYSLADALRLKQIEELTPKYLSNISAAQLLSAGVSIVAVSEAQQWLLKNGTSLKRRPPEGNVEIQAIQRAIATLDAFYFDTERIRSQFNFLQEGNC